MGDRTPPPGQLLGASSGIELAGTSAYATSTAGTEGASGTSTPASELGGGGAPASRPLLSRILRSTERPPLESSEQQARRRTERHAGGGSGSLQLLSPAAVGSSEQTPQQGQQQRGVPALDDCTSLSFGKGAGLAELGSISLHGQGDGDESDTAASMPEPQFAAQLGAFTGEQQAADNAAPSRVGSSAVLLTLEQASRPSSAGIASSAPLLPLGPAPMPAGGLDALAALDALPAAPQHHASSSFDVAAALGYDQTPPNPEQIYAAMLSKGGPASSAGSDGVPAVYPSGALMGGESASGPEGMATRWWAAHHGELVGSGRAQCQQRLAVMGGIADDAHILRIDRHLDLFSASVRRRRQAFAAH